MRLACLLLLFVAAPAFAHPCRPARPAPPPPLLEALKKGFGLTAGFRWDRECPDAAVTQVAPLRPREDNEDPFFVGAELRLPLAPRSGIFANLDRDFTDAPHWNARIGGYFRPWR